MKYDNQLRQANEIIQSYNGSIPLATWLKDYFRQHKKAGSRDRKTLATIVYSWYRLGHLQFTNAEEKMRAAIAISPGVDELRQYFNIAEFELTESDQLFPWIDQLTERVDREKFVHAFLAQPDVFLRARPGKLSIVEQKLRTASIPIKICGDDCLSVPSSTRLDDIIEIDREAVVQDKNSQRIGELMKMAAGMLNKTELKVWDCCAASGGKSILASDLLSIGELTVTDIRENILHNLKARFIKAGINNYRSQVIDLTRNSLSQKNYYDLVIADVPCSGSGTWARTPEQMYFFDEKKLLHYVGLQRAIMNNVIQNVSAKGIVLYITCSVFRNENEGMLEYMNGLGWRPVVSEVFAGYSEKADTLFAALLTNSAA